jgi:hypothetical protein
MLRVLTNLFFCLILLACPLICRSGNGCCATPGVGIESDCGCCCCETSDCSHEERDGPANDSASLCLCKGAVLVDAFVFDIEPLELGWIDAPSLLLVGVGPANGFLNRDAFVDSCNEIDRLTVRLQV